MINKSKDQLLKGFKITKIGGAPDVTMLPYIGQQDLQIGRWTNIYLKFQMPETIGKRVIVIGFWDGD